MVGGLEESACQEEGEGDGSREECKIMMRVDISLYRTHIFFEIPRCTRLNETNE